MSTPEEDGTHRKLGPREMGRKQKGKAKPQAIRQAKARRQALKRKLVRASGGYAT